MLITLPSGRPTFTPLNPSTWTEVASAVAGTAVTSSALELDISSAVAFHRRRPLFQGIATGAQSVATSTWTAIPLSEIIDVHGGHSDDANTSRVAGADTANAADWYLISGYVPFAATAGTTVGVVGVRLNGGGTIFEGMKIPGGTGHATDMLVVELLQMSDADYIELMGWQNSGGALSTVFAGKSSSLTMQWVASTTGTTVALPSAPRTWTAADLLTADSTGGAKVPLNLHIRDVLRFLRYPPIARITSAGTAQTIPSGAGTWTSIAFPAETVDTYAGHDLVTNNSRYTCQRAGVYYIYGLAAVSEPNPAVGYRAARLLVNGTTVYAGSSSGPGTASTAGTALAASAQLRLAANDYVELQLQQTHGSALSVKTGAGDASRLIAVWKSL